jgi:hypothetical protein
MISTSEIGSQQEFTLNMSVVVLEHAKIRVAALLACLPLIATAQPHQPFTTASDDASPRMAQLRDSVREKRPTAVNSFWDEIRKAGSPLIEPVPGEPQYSWVTFVWQAMGNTANVAIIDGVPEASANTIRRKT